jgi:hypothetical protein
MQISAAKKILIAGSIVATMLVMSNVWGQYASGQNSASDDQTAVRDALRRGGIREAARIKGHYVGEFDPHWDFGRFDIEALAKNSAVVIMGTPTKKVSSRLSQSGQTILTDYEVEVREVFKGQVSVGSSITVALPGGFIEFEDGTTAELKAHEFEPMKLGATYTIFLSEGDATLGVYTLTGGPQGLLEVVNDRTLKSHGRPTDPVSEESRGKDKETFLKEVRGKSAKWPLPGKCCR